ncbi:ABC transporter ATP-binding protein [Candidatus Bathyarchaeota archaeon]|nr:MAG: ABC transporter ATP-binding protein [Candidatus Bathyarchaeota archaeon]
MPEEHILITENLTKAFGGLVAVNKVNIRVRRNSITLLIGPNGAGKTTFINVCTGVLKPDGGRVIFDGTDITGWPPHRIYELGFVRTFQIPMPFQTLTVLDNVLAAMKSKGENPFRALLRPAWLREEEEHVEKALEILCMVGLDEHWDRPAHTLGGGQLKMLEVARALASGAKMIALDEPIGGVDPAYADEILSRVRDLKKYGLTFLIVEHRIDIAAPYADYAYAMDRGRIIAQGSPQEVLNDPKVVEVYIG